MSSGSSRSLGAKHVVPVTERRGIVTHKVLVVVVMVVSTGPNREKVSKRPGEIVTRVRINGLEESHNNPADNGNQVHLTKDVSVKQRATNGTHASHGNLNRVCVLSCQTKGSSVLVMLLVNVLVQRTVMKGSVEPVVPSILHEEKRRDLQRKVLERGKVGRNVNVKKGANRLEGKDGHGLNKRVGNQHVLETLHLLGCAGDLGLLDLVFAEKGDTV